MDGAESTCESYFETDVATGPARKEANKQAECLLHKPRSTLSNHSGDVEDMLLQWRASPKLGVSSTPQSRFGHGDKD